MTPVSSSRLRKLLNRNRVADFAQRGDLNRGEQVYAAVMENMAEGLYVVDRDGRMVMMNAAATRLLGWAEDELSGHRLHDLIHYQRANGTPLPVAECEITRSYRAGRALRAHDDVFTHKDGSIVPVAYTVSPLVESGKTTGAVVVFRELVDAPIERPASRGDPETRSRLRTIREALDEHRLTLYAQPIVPLDGGAPADELLLRMVGRDGAVIPPCDFLPLAEQYGLIGEIDCWVVAEAIRHAAAGRRVDVNLSANSIGDPKLLAVIERELRATRAVPANVVFEITETALIQDIGVGEAFARALTDLGCELALDDFGMGFGSFTYLKRLPLSYLKIDIEFVRHLRWSSANQHVVKAIVQLARGFGHATIAEGVEDEETVLMLSEYGVDYAQGFHLGPPAPVLNGRAGVAHGLPVAG